ncbi:hypothetical protein [Lacticaseibacillus phage Lphi2ADMT26]|nr:hypothetical protein [Lacticaseibacillus phage Lphi2ADMT26]
MRHHWYQLVSSLLLWNNSNRYATTRLFTAISTVINISYQ